jgi:hypothetical protein
MDRMILELVALTAASALTCGAAFAMDYITAGAVFAAITLWIVIVTSCSYLRIDLTALPLGSTASAFSGAAMWNVAVWIVPRWCNRFFAIVEWRNGFSRRGSRGCCRLSEYVCERQPQWRGGTASNLPSALTFL